MTILDKPPYVEPKHKKAPLELPALPVPYAMTRTDRVPAKRYYDPEFYAMENELLWPRVWQMACYLAEIPNPGDYVTYEILGKSIIVVRIDETTVRAFHNACRHRGVEVVAEGNGNVLKGGFICPFHGWCYGLDGANTFLYQPDLFDESNRRPEDLALVPCRVETWGGSAFINLDDNAPSLRECIGPLRRLPRRVEGGGAVAGVVALVSACRPTGSWPWRPSWRATTSWRPTRSSIAKTRSRRLSIGRHSAQSALRSGAMAAVDGPWPGVDTSTRRSSSSSQLHFMRMLSIGMAGMIHEKDVRIAEGLRNLELPDDFSAGCRRLERSALNDAIMAWNERQGIDMPDLNYIMNNGQCSPAWSSASRTTSCCRCYSSSSAYRIRPLGPEECLFELWSLTRYPPGQAAPGAAAARRRWLPTTRAGLLSRLRTTRTCPASRRACTPRASSTCGCRTGSRA